MIKRLVIFTLMAIFMTSTSVVSYAKEEPVETTEESFDEKLNNFMGPVTDAVNSVIFFSLPYGEEVTIEKYDKKTKKYRLDFNEHSPAVSLDTDNDPLKGTALVLEGTNEGTQLSYQVIDGEDTTAVVMPGIQMGQSTTLALAGGMTTDITFSGDAPALGQRYQILHQNKMIPFVLIWLVVGAVFFTFFFKFINLRGFRHALDVVRGKYDDPNHKGEVSHFQALTAALSGTVGIGNIAGVAVAVSLGGPGATFWMIVAGLLGMSSKFVECTLGVKYRKVNDDGSVSGGPMYYLSQGLAKRGKGFANLGKVLAVLFAIACIGGSCGGGNMVQINQATSLLTEATGGEDSIFFGNGWIFGTAMAVIVGVIIIGGIKSIAKVTDKVVPFMVAIYVAGALIVLAMNIPEIPGAFGKIFGGAFSSEAMYGGIIGVLIQGFRRAAFSNEAGIGSASIAHSAAKTDEPVSEGLVSLLEPFIDTVVICTMTALVIVISNYGSFDQTAVLISQKAGDLDAIKLTSSSFAKSISWFPIILTIAVILFALSTMISWSYYGLKAWTYLFGETKVASIIYKVIFCVMIIVGSAISAKQVFDLGDAMIFAMCFPNVLGLYFLAPEIRTDLKDYMARVKSGAIKRYKA